MITKKNKTLIIKAIGTEPIAKIYEWMDLHGFRNSNSKPYSRSHISNILNGQSNHDIIENAIIDCALFHAEEKLREKEHRQLKIEALQNVISK
jgi:hypothetical protein